MGKPFSFRHRFFSRFHDVIISKIGRGCLVGAALRAVRTPTNMGVAQLASHSPHYPNSRMLPIFHFLRRLPQRSRRRRAPTSEPIGRGGSALASLGLARYKSRATLTRRLPPCRPRTTDASVGAALRAVRIQRTPRRGVPTTWRPYHATALPRGRALLKPPPHCKRPFFRIVAKPLANRILRDIICLFFERLVIPNAMIEKSALPYNIESIGHPFLDFSNNSGK